MKLAKFDELDSLIRGMLYIEANNPSECYYWANPTEDEKCEKQLFDFSSPYPFMVRKFKKRNSLVFFFLETSFLHKVLLYQRQFETKETELFHLFTIFSKDFPFHVMNF